MERGTNRVTPALFDPGTRENADAADEEPAEIMERMLALRVHLDNCGLENGPVRVLPGSHLCGRLSEAAIEAWKQRATSVDCPIPRGGVLVFRPLILHASSPATVVSHRRVVHAAEPKMTSFVFKIQANMDPNHRDRVAFMRMVSGHFKRGMKLKPSSTGKVMSVHNPVLFFASDREIVDEAWPGDVMGIPNHGTLRVGDTLTEGEDLVFTGIPNFAPEIIRRVRLGDPLKAKHLQRALESLAEEGVTQVFKPQLGSQWFVGVVGQLQLDVLAQRIATEYGLEVSFEGGLFETARWVKADDPAELKKFMDAHKGNMAEDRDGAPVFLAKSGWELSYTAGKFPAVRFTATKERG